MVQHQERLTSLKFNFLWPPTATRFIHIHKNLPGALKLVNDTFSDRNINITAQYLQTFGDIGYVVMDAEGKVADEDDIIHELRAREETIRVRVVKGPH